MIKHDTSPFRRRQAMAYPANRRTGQEWSCVLLLIAAMALSQATAFATGPIITGPTITGAAPGNLFVSGSPAVFQIAGAQGDLHYDLVDYFGKAVAQGDISPTGSTAEVRVAWLAPGWYELHCRDGVGEASASLGVVIDRQGAALALQGRVCADAASAWLLKPEQIGPFAHMVALAGIPWVRERLAWREVEPSDGQFDWGKYQAVADALHAQGVHIDQIFHDSPVWAHPQNPSDPSPDDLRTVYQFLKAAAGHFSGQYGSWEVWNEPDGSFWPDLGDRFAGLQKAAYFGIKDGDPHALVLQGSLVMGVTPFERSLFDQGVGSYLDVFNWHCYDEHLGYASALDDHRRLLAGYGLANLPAWVTETGIHLPATDGPGGQLLNPANQQAQCRYMARSIATSLAAGDQKHFYFVLPDYREGQTQFGALHPDLTPYPSFIALSAAANILGLARFIGQYDTGPAGVAAYLFSTPKGAVLVAWSDTHKDVRLPVRARSVRVANIFGDETEQTADHGLVDVIIGPDPVYILASRSGFNFDASALAKSAGLDGDNSRAGPRRQPASRIVVVGHTDLAQDHRSNCYIIPSGAAGSPETSFTYSVDVYNFSGKDTTAGVIDIHAPSGWLIDEPTHAFRLSPMGRVTFSVNVRPAPAGAGVPMLSTTVLLNSGGANVTAHDRPEQVTPSVSWFEWARH